MRTFLRRYLATLLPFLLLDALWLGRVAPAFYQSRLAHLLGPTPNLAAAAVFYLLYVVGVVALVVTPSLQEGVLFRAALRGALFGLVAYATYDLTNLATLRDWPWIVTVVDMLWGTVLTAVSALAGAWLAGRWENRR